MRVLLAGTAASLACLPHTLAQELNYYRREGLVVTTDVVPGGGAKALQALLGGSTDVIAGYYDQPVRMAAQGKAIPSFVTMTRYPGNVVVTSPANAERIQTVRDLKRALVGVSDLGAQSYWFLNYVLVRNGLAPADITAVPIGNQSSALAALEHGKLDAWSGFDPGVAQLLKRHPNVRILADARTQKGVREIFGVDAYPGFVLYAKSDWLRNNTDTARRLARAIQASLRWIHQHSPDEIMAVVPPAHFGEDRSVYREALLHSIDMFSEDGRMPAGGPEAVRKVLATFLEPVKKARFDVDGTYTNAFVTGQ